MNEIRNKKFRVDKIIFYNKDSKWGALGTSPIDSLGDLEYTLMNEFGSIGMSGNFEGVFEGCEVEVTGNIVNNPKYGKQVQITFLKVIQDLKNKESVINFLAKSVIKGISMQNAKKIYEMFKERAVDVVLNNPDELIKINGIGSKTVQKVKDSVEYYKSIEDLVKFGTAVGLSYYIINKLHEELGDEALGIIKEDPFKILEVSQIISFKQVDEIYLKCNGDPQGKRRLEVGLLYSLRQLVMLEGSTGCKMSLLQSKFYNLLGLNEGDDFFKRLLLTLEDENKIYIDKDKGLIYYKEYLDIEKNISEKVLSLNTLGIKGDKIKDNIVEEEIKNFPFELNEQQKEAIYKCLNSNVAVLTGSAGSGKSTISKALYRIYERCGFNVELLSPTAKACRRLEECTGGVAQTIHKFLGMQSDGSIINRGSFENSVFLVDEASMMDIILFNHLLNRMTLTSRILLVGDNNQLPSVQAGNVLGDLIDSNKVSTSQLTEVMRQKDDSSIIKYCNDINKGIVFDPVELKDFHYEEFGNGDELREFLVKKYLEEVINYGLSEVQVITPYKRGELGMNNLNIILQGVYNKNGKELIEPYRMGDRVRHTQNNYKKDVYNGEVGVIVEETEDEDIIVDYGNKRIIYDSTDIDELTLSYCSTVHASQGSEYKVCFVILDDTATNDFLFIRRLLYTAVSRGKKKVYILTKPYLVDHCIENNSYKPRITKLKEFLEKVD